MGFKFKFNPFTSNFDVVESATDTSLTSTNYLGSDCTGLDGDPSRKLTHLESPSSIIVDRQFLHPAIDYTVIGNIVTFKNLLFNSMNITIWS